MTWIIFVSSLVLGFLILMPLGIKWELDKKIVMLTAFVIGILSGAIVNGISVFYSPGLYHVLMLEISVIIALSSSLLLWRFYRDPERIPPEDENVILSPADGRIIYVKTIEDGKIPYSEKNGRKIPLDNFVQSDVLAKGGYIIGISMSYLDVHVNRAPIGGRIALLKHIKGLFISLKKNEAIFQNERVLTVIDEGHFKVGVVQIASRMVRKIVPYIGEGEEIRMGGRIGTIRFGSQVDLILPNLSFLQINVVPGIKVKAGMSIVATFDKLNSLA